MYYQGEMEKKDRRKIIAIAGAIVAVILILIVAIVVVATRKSTPENVGGEDNSTFSITEGEKKTNDKDAAKETAKTETKPATTTNTPAATSSTATAGEMPSTGPEDMLPLALSLGSLTTAGAAYVMSKRRV